MTTLKPPFTRSDLVMIRQAIRHRWNIPLEARVSIVRELRRAIGDAGTSVSVRMATDQTLRFAMEAGWNSVDESSTIAGRNG